MTRSNQVLACFKCKVYVHIIPDNAENLEVLNNFKNRHIYHMVCILNISEIKKINNNYKEHKI